FAKFLFEKAKCCFSDLTRDRLARARGGHRRRTMTGRGCQELKTVAVVATVDQRAFLIPYGTSISDARPARKCRESVPTAVDQRALFNPRHHGAQLGAALLDLGVVNDGARGLR